MVTGCVFFVVKAKRLNIMKTSFGFKGLIQEITLKLVIFWKLFDLGLDTSQGNGETYEFLIAYRIIHEHR
jgi:hypothetical protein